MAAINGNHIVLVAGATAAALAQILPVLLLTLTVELRRTQLHREFSRVLLGVFFLFFGLIETTLVLSIDGAFYPFQWFDICPALIIFSLLSILFWVALSDPRSEERIANSTAPPGPAAPWSTATKKPITS